MSENFVDLRKGEKFATDKVGRRIQGRDMFYGVDMFLMGLTGFAAGLLAAGGCENNHGIGSEDYQLHRYTTDIEVLEGSFEEVRIK